MGGGGGGGRAVGIDGLSKGGVAGGGDIPVSLHKYSKN